MAMVANGGFCKGTGWELPAEVTVAPNQCTAQECAVSVEFRNGNVHVGSVKMHSIVRGRVQWISVTRADLHAKLFSM